MLAFQLSLLSEPLPPYFLLSCLFPFLSFSYSLFHSVSIDLSFLFFFCFSQLFTHSFFSFLFSFISSLSLPPPSFVPSLPFFSPFSLFLPCHRPSLSSAKNWTLNLVPAVQINHQPSYNPCLTPVSFNAAVFYTTFHHATTLWCLHAVLMYKTVMFLLLFK